MTHSHPGRDDGDADVASFSAADRAAGAPPTLPAPTPIGGSVPITSPITSAPVPASDAGAHGNPPSSPPPFRSWVPIRSLSARHRDAILAHLLGLPEEDRFLRFGFAAADPQIRAYVDRLDFERDEVYGVFNRRLQLIALGHLAFPPLQVEPSARPPGTASPQGLLAEFGGSVSPHARRRGYGARLFEHGVLKARNRDIDTLFIHALSGNVAMLKIARAAGARVTRFGSEAEAYLSLMPENWATRLEQWIVGGVSWVDFGLKQQTLKVDGLLRGIGEVADAVGHGGHLGRE